MNDYPRNMRLRPIQSWPGEQTRVRRVASFSAPWRSTLELLTREISHLERAGGPGSVLQIAVQERDLRISDGMPKAHAKMAHPGVIVSIESEHGPMSLPCDTFTDWHDNLRAIALTLEALRKIDRYGVTRTGQQYTGFQQLGAAPAEVPLDVAAATELLRTHGTATTAEASDRTDTGTVAQLYRRAAANTHPDRGGNRDDFARVQAAADVLRKAGLL